MKKLIGILISIILSGFSYVGSTFAIDITIDPGAYTGKWSVDYGPSQQGVAQVSLGAADPVINSHLISISGAELFFNVDAFGQVSVISRAAAKGRPGKLIFKTTAIEVDPAHFPGKWRVTQGATAGLTGRQSVTLVAGLKFYNMKVGANGGFTFHVGRNGEVTVKNSIAGSGSIGTLTFNNTERFMVSTQ
jgi:hypothetical protein